METTTPRRAGIADQGAALRELRGQGDDAHHRQSLAVLYSPSRGRERRGRPPEHRRAPGRGRAPPGGLRAASPHLCPPPSSSRPQTSAAWISSIGAVMVAARKPVTPCRAKKPAMVRNEAGSASMVSQPSAPCTCRSIRPGASVRPSRSMTSAPREAFAGAVHPCPGAAMRPSRTSTQPSAQKPSRCTDRRHPERARLGSSIRSAL